MTTSIYGLTDSVSQANDIVHALRDGGFVSDHISLLFSDSSSASRDSTHKPEIMPSADVLANTSIDAVAGGALGWLAGIDLLVIPSVGLFVAAGPIMAVLSADPPDALDHTTSRIAGCLMGMGMPEYVANRYEGKIANGQFLIAVSADDSDQIANAAEIYGRTGAHDIGYCEDVQPVRHAATQI